MKEEGESPTTTSAPPPPPASAARGLGATTDRGPGPEEACTNSIGGRPDKPGCQEGVIGHTSHTSRKRRHGLETERRRTKLDEKASGERERNDRLG